MFTLVLNITFALFTVLSLHSTFENELQEKIDFINRKTIVNDYFANLTQLFETLKSDEPTQIERNAHVEAVIAQLNEKVKETLEVNNDPITELVNLAPKIQDSLFEGNSLFSVTEQETFVKKLTEINSDVYTKLPLPATCIRNSHYQPDVNNTTNPGM